MFAGAAFTDQADIKATDAVDTLVALGVVEGFEDGSFQPNATVTRAQMAKMIYVLRTGKSDASAYNNDKTSFTDINGHWAAGYIKYCQSLGIIAGKSSTIFAPNASVTAQEAAKMLLVTLGYNAEKAGLTGPSWASRTNALADEAGLLKDVNTSFTAACPRQYAAQLIYNTIFAPTVVLRDGEYTKYGYDNSPNATVGEKYMDLDKASVGQLYACTKVDGKDYYDITVAGTTAHPARSYTKVPVDVSELLGQEVVVLIKDNAKETTVYGVYADEDSKVLATGLLGDFELDGAEKVKLNGTSYKVDGADNTANLVREANKSAFSATQLDDLAVAAAKGTITPATAATTLKLIDNNGNGKVDAAVITPAQVGKVTAVSKTSVTVDFLTVGVANKAIKFEDAEVYDGIKKDDFVTVVAETNRASDKDLITKLDVVSAKADSTRTNEVKANSNWYKLAVSDTSTPNPIAVTTGNTYDFVIVGNVVVDADETAASASNVAYISAVKKDSSNPDLDTTLGEKTGTVKVRMYFQDGTDAEVKVSKIDGKKMIAYNGTPSADEVAATTANLPEHVMYTYSKLSDGTYDVKAVGSSNKVGLDWQTSLVVDTDSKNTNNSLYFKQKIAKYAIADDAVVFVQVQGETKTLTGKQVKNWSDVATPAFTSGTQMLTKDSNGIAYVKFATLVNTGAGSKVPGASNDKLYAYLTSDSYQADVDGEKKAAYDVWTGSENVTLYEDVSSRNISAGSVIEYSEDGKYIDNVAVVGAYKDTVASLNNAANINVAAITGFDNGTVAYRDKTNAKKSADLDDDCVFIAVNDDKTEGMEGSKDTVTKANEYVDAGTTYYVPNAYVVLNTDGDVVAIVFDADNSELNVTYGASNVGRLLSK
ncbi:MAG: S-layer homology domain-containing protein [Agathobaculum sp.]